MSKLLPHSLSADALKIQQDLMQTDVRYWLQDERIQNFGDFLSEYFLQNLFFPQPRQGRELRLIGSCIDDWFVSPSEELHARGIERPIFWGCGLRKPDGLSMDRQDAAEILAVRGPLTRSALRLGEMVPIGDPGLLLPAIHRAARLRRSTGATLLVPHFHDRRSDMELLSASGCSAVLRPNIPKDLSAVEEFIDQIVASDFVLTGSLHAAVVAAAYGRPFAFWDSGDIDIPFKWEDFAASVGIMCAFQPDLAAARQHYQDEIAPKLTIPVLWPLLLTAPLPVRLDAFITVVEQDVTRHGAAVLQANISSMPVNRMHARLKAIAAQAESAPSLRAQLDLALATERQLNERLATEQEAIARLEGRLRESQTSLEQAAAAEAALQRELAAQAEAYAASETSSRDLRRAAEGFAKERITLHSQVGRLQSAASRMEVQVAALRAEEARLHLAVKDRDFALVAAQQDAAAQAAQVERMARSASWKLSAPVRMAQTRMPRTLAAMQRLAQLTWWCVTLQVFRRLRQLRARHAEAAVLDASPLFDAAFYLAQLPPDMPPADAAAHYVVHGAALGLSPCRLFDPAWYLATYREVAASELTPFAHYLQRGAALGHDPHPLFDTIYYAAENPAAGAGAMALLHYLREGAPSGRGPNRLFDPAGYFCEYPDAAESGPDAFEHFVRIGASLGYHPHPLFDTAWYAGRHPEVAASGMNPLAYYLRIGAAKGHRCSPLQTRITGLVPEQELDLPTREDPEASIIIPVYGRYFDTVRCLYALAAHSGHSVGYEVIVLDDKPGNPSAPLLAAIPGLRVVGNQTNLGFLRNCNQAITIATGWHLIFLNNDTLVEPDWLEPLLRLVRNDLRVGMVGCKLLNADGTVQEAGGLIFRDGWGTSFGRGDDPAKPEYNYVREVDVVIGAAFLVRRDLFTALGGFDDRYAPAYYEEFDLAFEIRKAGYKVLYQPRSEVTHLGSTSYGSDMRDRQSVINHAKFCIKWEAELERQPSGETDLFLARQRAGAIGIILMIDDKVPEYDRHAGALTIFQYAKLMLKLGFRLVYGPSDLMPLQPYTAALQDRGVEVITTPQTISKWLSDHGGHLTAVWTARPDVSFDLLETLRATTSGKLLYYPHDLHYLRSLRRYNMDGDVWSLGESKRYKKLEFAIFGSVDCVMTPSSEEASIIRRDVPEATVKVIPPYLYPAGSSTSVRNTSFAERLDILFIGGFKHPPNVDAAEWLVAEIMPLIWQQVPETRLMLVGDAPPPEVKKLASDRVDVTGYVADLAPYLARARLSLCPLRYGAGVKGKVVSALQAGLPVVTTAIGNEGILLEDGTQVLLGETSADLAAAAVRLLQDPELCASLSRASATVLRRRYSEDGARAALMDVLDMDFCNVCGCVSAGDANYPHPQTGNWSERFACESCHAQNRTQVLAEMLLTPVRGNTVGSLRAATPYLSRLRIHEFSFLGSVTAYLDECPLYTSSDYFEGLGSGEYAENGVLCQDLQALSFRDNEIDLLVSQDVLGHVPDLSRALCEIHRVLKPAGRHVFTVPIDDRLETTRLRAELMQAERASKPRSHSYGDPAHQAGAHARHNFGWDLLSMLDAAGFAVNLHERFVPGIPGGHVVVFSATKRSPSAVQ